MTLEGTVELITSYLPEYFCKYYSMTSCYNEAMVYVYAVRLNDAGRAFSNESAPYLYTHYYIKITEYADGEHREIETGYSDDGGKSEDWIEKI